MVIGISTWVKIHRTLHRKKKSNLPDADLKIKSMPQAEKEQRKDRGRKRGRWRGGERGGGQEDEKNVQARRTSCRDVEKPLKQQNKLKCVETVSAGNVTSGMETRMRSGPRRPGSAAER